ncbi:hypothetical protein [Leyella stercorea]|uniref:hypothetical protein n=1 Tax=Leyella stercorea TaxID=363265 RepID=UPI0026DB170D|nr:hypothetical protein [Leyella stercorea]
MKQADYIRLTAQIAVLKEIAVDYSGKTIDNIIQQLEAIRKEVADACGIPVVGVIGEAHDLQILNAI